MERNWECIKQYEEILFDFWNGIARITINRPRYRNAFTPLTVAEMSDALRYCREAQEVCGRCPRTLFLCYILPYDMRLRS